jgi:apolipoprotein N-acyltransferase
LFIKIQFEREKVVLFALKIKNFKTPPPKKNCFKWVFLGGCIGFFLGGFFWVGFLMPTLPAPDAVASHKIELLPSGLILLFLLDD